MPGGFDAREQPGNPYRTTLTFMWSRYSGQGMLEQLQAKLEKRERGESCGVHALESLNTLNAVDSRNDVK